MKPHILHSRHSFRSPRTGKRLSIGTCSLTTLSAAALSALLLAASSGQQAQAQRPSLGGLQQQINDLNFNVDSFFDVFTELSVGDRSFEALAVDNVVRWGGSGGECTIGIQPGLPGLTESDPTGFRLLGPNNQGCRLIFGPTMDCTVEIDPQGPPGLLLRDLEGVRLLPPDSLSPPRLIFGPTDDCSIGVFPDLPGLTETDPTGFRLLGPGGQGCRLIFGPTMDCTIEIDPQGPPGLLLRDPSGIRLLPPPGSAPPRLIFGPTDDCTIGIAVDATGRPFSGLSETDPQGFRLLGQNQEGCILRFGPTDECSVRIDPPGGLTGLIESDPNGVRLLGPGGEGCILTFGPTDLCRIFIDLERAGMIFEDPGGFFFQGPAGTQTLMDVQGTIVANEVIQRSSRDLKENIRPLENALDTVKKLHGVAFDWKAEEGGKPAIGFIADEVAEVLPQVTSFDENGKAAGVQYANVVALVVEGVKAQQEQIEELQAENAALKDDLNALRESKDAKMRNEIDSLKAQMAELAASIKPATN